jgi:hypothetical protein
MNADTCALEGGEKVRSRVEIKENSLYYAQVQYTYVWWLEVGQTSHSLANVLVNK